MIVEKIFDKDINSLEEDDLKNLIDIPETLNLEFKTISDIPGDLNHIKLKKKLKENEENVIKSVVGLLNSNVSGLVVLGVKTKKEVGYKIQGVDKNTLKQFKSEISLEDFLKEKIKSIPSFLNEYSLETKIVPFKNRIVVFIEVHNEKWERIFYSGITDYVYIRKAKSTNKKTLEETLKLLAERSYPQIYCHFGDIRKHSRDKERITVVYRLAFNNEGVKTTDKFHSFILIGSDEPIHVEFNDGRAFSLERLNPKIFNLTKFIESYEYHYLRQYIFPSKNMVLDRIYPFNEFSLSNLTFFEDEIDKIKAIILINIEDRGFVKQEFEVSLRNNERIFKEMKREFNPYLSL